jgi:hypothetical protein
MDILVIIGTILLVLVAGLFTMTYLLAKVSAEVFGRDDDWLEYGQDEEL